MYKRISIRINFRLDGIKFSITSICFPEIMTLLSNKFHNIFDRHNIVLTIGGRLIIILINLLNVKLDVIQAIKKYPTA